MESEKNVLDEIRRSIRPSALFQNYGPLSFEPMPIFKPHLPEINIPCYIPNELDRYMRELIQWFRSVGWSYEQCKHALDEGLKVLK